jgi:hypothetical protein
MTMDRRDDPILETRVASPFVFDHLAHAWVP